MIVPGWREPNITGVLLIRIPAGRVRRRLVALKASTALADDRLSEDEAVGPVHTWPRCVDSVLLVRRGLAANFTENGVNKRALM